jgi:bifunctional DNase/RNase
MRLQGVAAERPLTHDLFVAAMEQLGTRVDRVVISDLADETYHARLYLVRDGIEVEVDARPSDALALAVRSDATIFAAEEVLDQAALGSDPDAEDEDEPDAEGEGSGEGPAGERRRRRRIPLESLGGAIADPRLDMFRDFVNSLDVDPSAGGESGGRQRS